nr:hypothetical protein [Nostoc sp. DedQUE07]MDZ8133222.1 hypothetical protein [Nostoc sp. DedQUE07]
MPTQRIIKSTFIGLNNEPLRNAVVQVIHMQGNSIDNIEYPQVTKNFVTDREGKIKFTLWCNEEGERSSFYRFVLPGGETFDAIVPVGTSDLELSVLREGGGNSSDPQHQSLITYILSQAGINLATNTLAGRVKTNTTSTDPVVYLKSEVDNLLSPKANQSTTYTKAQTDGLVNPKANSSDVYTKAQTDSLIAPKANATDVYNKTQVDNLVTPKANSSDTYTKAQTDALIGGVTVDLSGYYTKAQTDGLVASKANSSDVTAALSLKANSSDVTTSLATKANSIDVYTKVQTDTLISGTIPTTSKGIALGVATLDSGGKIPDTQIPDAITRDTELTAGLATKADTSTTYSKTQTDTLLTAKANQSSTYTKTEVDGLVTPKANSTDVYTKTQTDTLINARPDALNKLTDTTIATPFNGQTLIYNNTTSKWENQNLPVGSIGISVNISSVNYDSQNRVSSYISNGNNYVITYNTLTTVIVGGGKTRTITYNSTGQLVSDITI